MAREEGQTAEVATARTAGDRDLDTTFERVVDEYYQRVYNLIYRYIGDYDEACDLTQATFMRAYRGFKGFRGDSATYTWLYRIAINLCNNRLKQLRRQRRAEVESLDEPVQFEADRVAREVPDLRHAPETASESSEFYVYLHRCLMRLPADHRLVIVLRDVQGLSYAEIAEATDSSLEAVKSRLFRARTQLKEMLAPYLRGEATD